MKTDVATATAAPANSSYALVGSFQPLPRLRLLPPPAGRLLPWPTAPGRRAMFADATGVFATPVSPCTTNRNGSTTGGRGL